MAAVHYSNFPLGLMVSILTFLVLAGGIFIILKVFCAMVGGFMGGTHRRCADDAAPLARRMESSLPPGISPRLCQNPLCRRANVAPARFCSHCGSRLPLTD